MTQLTWWLCFVLAPAGSLGGGARFGGEVLGLSCSDGFRRFHIYWEGNRVTDCLASIAPIIVASLGGGMLQLFVLPLFLMIFIACLVSDFVDFHLD